MPRTCAHLGRCGQLRRWQQCHFGVSQQTRPNDEPVPRRGLKREPAATAWNDVNRQVRVAPVFELGTSHPHLDRLADTDIQRSEKYVGSPGDELTGRVTHR